MRIRTHVLAPWAGASLLAFVYLISMCRDLYWYDSAELAIAAVQPGLSHPPGQPLHTLVGHLLTYLVPGHPLIALNGLSAICAALCVIPAMRIVLHLDPATRSRPPWLATAVLVGLGLGNAVWDTATRIEVYAPTALMALFQLAHLLDTIEALNTLESKTNLPRRLFVQGLLLGLVFSLHPYIAVFLSIATVASLTRPLLLRRTRRPVPCAALLLAGGLLGLLPYAWIPLSTLCSGSIVWGDPSTLKNILYYLGGADYNLRAPFLTGLYQSVHYLGWLAGNVLYLPVLVAGIAAWWLGWKSKPWPGTGARFAPVILTVLCLFVIGRIGNYKPDIPDFLGYLLPAFWLAGAGLGAAAERARRTLVLKSRRTLVAGLIVAFAALSAFMPPSLPSRSRADNRIARTLATGFLIDAPRNAIIVAGSDHIVFPLLYLTEVEHIRPDVIVVPVGWAHSAWFWDHLYKRHFGVELSLSASGDRWDLTRIFLETYPDRPVIAEDLRMASLAAGPIIRSGWTLRAGAGSAGIDRPLEGARHDFARSRVHAWLHDHGKPGTQERRILAFIATQWGHDERTGGMPGQAVLDYLTGSPRVELHLPENLLDPRAWPELSPRPRIHQYELLSLPTFNLFCAGELLSQHSHGHEEGIRIVRQAAMLGSHEARLWLASHSIQGE